MTSADVVLRDFVELAIQNARTWVPDGGNGAVDISATHASVIFAMSWGYIRREADVRDGMISDVIGVPTRRPVPEVLLRDRRAGARGHREFETYSIAWDSGDDHAVPAARGQCFKRWTRREIVTALDVSRGRALWLLEQLELTGVP